MLIDLSSDDDGDLVAAPAVAPVRPTPVDVDNNVRDHRGHGGRHPIATDDEDDSEEEEEDDDSDDPDDNGSDLDDFIVSDSDGDDSDSDKQGSAADGDDSEAEFVPCAEVDDDDDVLLSPTTPDASSSLSPVITIASDDDEDDNNKDGEGVTIADADAAESARPTKRARVDDADTPFIDPNNIVSGKRCRRTTERYMDRHFMEFMVRDVPPSQIAAVFDDEDEYFRSGISLTDSSEDGDDGTDSEDDKSADDLDSSDYEAMDALPSSRRRRRGAADADRPAEASAPSDRAARCPPASSAPVDLSRPPSTVAALLRSLAAQPGGIRPSVASPRSAPTSRTQLPPP